MADPEPEHEIEPEPEHAEPEHAEPEHAEPEHAEPEHAEPDHEFDKWGLPKSDMGDLKPSDLGHPGIDIIYEWKLKTYLAWKAYKKNPNEQTEKSLRNCTQHLLLYRTFFFEHTAFEPTPWGEDPPKMLAWDASLAETMVTHNIFSKGRGYDTHGQLPTGPLQYVLRDPDSNVGTNVVARYKEACKNKDHVNGVRVVWAEIREFMLKQCGVLIAQGMSTLKVPSTYAVHQMQILEAAMSTAQETVQQQAAGHALGLEYHGYDRTGLRLAHATGGIEIRVCLGATSVNDLNSILYPEYVRRVVSRTMTHYIDGHSGLFVSIILTSNGEVSEHYLFLSEYERNKMKGAFACGFEDEFDRDENGDASFQLHEVALTPALINKAPPHPNARSWVVSSPLTERMVLTDCLTNLRALYPFDQSGAAMQRLRQWAEREKKAKGAIAGPEDLPVAAHFFSGDNVMFMTLAFDTSLDWVCNMLGLDRDTAAGRRYIAVMTVRYPSLFANVEKFMINMRFQYFILNGGNPHRWKQWKRGTWALPTPAQPAVFRPPFDPTDYQEKPAMRDPLDVPVMDENGRQTYPFRRVISLPWHATYQGICERRLRRHQPALTKDFFVNNLDPDPAVVYVYELDDSVETDAAWNDIQLFRINAERLVSKEMAERKKESFFAFRRAYYARAQQGWNLREHPFKLYLRKYPEIRTYWSMLWRREYNDMAGWRRRDPSQAPPRAQPQPNTVDPPTGPGEPDGQQDDDQQASRARANGVRSKEALRRGFNERFLHRLLNKAE